MWIASNKRFYNSAGELVGNKSIMTTKNKKPPNHQLTDEKAIEILRWLKSNMTKAAVAKIFDISWDTVHQLGVGKSYRHIDRTTIEPYTNFTEEANVEKLEL